MKIILPALVGLLMLGCGAANAACPTGAGSTSSTDTAVMRDALKEICSSGTGSTNGSVGTDGAAAKTSSTLIGVSDGTNQQQVVAPIGLADGVNGNNSVSVGGYVWNGTTWDRMPGGTTGVAVKTADPCSSVAKSSAAIAISTATTTSLVAVSGSKAVYVCGYSFSIAPSATAADTALIEYGTGASCTGTHALTGTYGDGDLTSAAPPLFVSAGNSGSTVLTAPASNGICLVSAGTAVSIQGQITYVQQ